MSYQDKEAAQRSLEIDKRLASEYDNRSKEVKLLLLGKLRSCQSLHGVADLINYWILITSLT